MEIDVDDVLRPCVSFVLVRGGVDVFSCAALPRSLNRCRYRCGASAFCLARGSEIWMVNVTSNVNDVRDDCVSTCDDVDDDVCDVPCGCCSCLAAAAAVWP